jgi:hypothetical protein
MRSQILKSEFLIQKVCMLLALAELHRTVLSVGKCVKCKVEQVHVLRNPNRQWWGFDAKACALNCLNSISYTTNTAFQPI